MALYYSTFAAGFEPAVQGLVEREYAGTQLERLLEGAVLYRRKADPGRPAPAFFNNTFLCLTTFPRFKRDYIAQMVRLALRRGVDSESILAHLPPEAQTLRVLFMLEGKLAHAGDRTLQATEEYLCAAAGLKVGRARPDVEFWFVYRREGMGFLLMRLTGPRTAAHSPQPGELRPDLAHMLVALSDPKPGDVFLDPFAGAGALPRARLDYAPGTILASDTDQAAVLRLRNALGARPGLSVSHQDALTLPDVASGRVDTIVTDPPWGAFAELEDARLFYAQFAVQARRVLKRDGRLVLLSARKRDVQEAFATGFAPLQRLDVLISGKKAGVFVYRRL